MSFLIEPYNAYQKPPKKKHWHEIIEEEALFHRIQLEEARLQQQTNLNNQNVALPQYAPQPASQQVQDGQFAAPAGGGGWVLPSELEAQEQANFSVSPASGVGPLTVTFTNLTISPDNDTFLWNFGSGSLTSTAITPPTLTYTQTGSYVIKLQETSSTGNMTVTTRTITVNVPTVTAAFTYTTGANVAPMPVTFSNASTTNNIGTLNYNWSFGSASLTSTTTNPKILYGNPGIYTASLSATESIYGIGGLSANTYITVPAPTLTANFTFVSSSGTAPSTVTFTNTINGSGTHYNGIGTLTYFWNLGSGSLTSTGLIPTPTEYTVGGTYLVQLQVTESLFNISSSVTKTFTIA
jgi:PKD repeat protein